MNVIIKLEIFILFQKTLSQYAPNHYQRQFTKAAYYLPFQNEEYSWTKKEHIKTRKPHRRRKKYNDYFISVEMNYEPKRLQCKCICKKYESKPIHEYEQNDQCCQSYCDNNLDNRDYSNGVYTPTQYTDTIINEINTPATYPSIIYSNVYMYDMGKMFPWVAWGLPKTTKTDTNGDKNKNRTSTNDDNNKTSTIDDRDQISTRDDRDVTYTNYDKDKRSTMDAEYKTTTTKDDSDKNYSNGDKTNTKEDRDKTSTIDDRFIITTIDDRHKTSTKHDEDKTGTKENPIEESTPKAGESTTTERKHSTAESTQSTSSYFVREYLKKLSHTIPKKKPCLRDNYSLKDTNRKVGRYYEDDLVERPTVASYLNGNIRRKYNVQEKLYDERSHYGIIPIPDKLAMKFMNDCAIK